MSLTKILLSMALVLQATNAASLSDQSVNELLDFRTDVQASLKSHEFMKKKNMDQSLTNLLNEVAARTNPKSALDLNRAVQLTREVNLTTIITNAQTEVDELFTFLIDLVIPNVVNQTTILQDDLVNPLLTLVDGLADLTIVQSVTEVYAVVVSAETILTALNATLTLIDSTSSTVIEGLTTAQSVIDAIFDFILSIV